MTFLSQAQSLNIRLARAYDAEVPLAQVLSREEINEAEKAHALN